MQSVSRQREVNPRVENYAMAATPAGAPRDLEVVPRFRDVRVDLPPDAPRVLLATGKLVGEGFDHPPLVKVALISQTA